MLAEEALAAALLGAAGIVAQVGARIGPQGGIVDDAAPAISFQRVATVPASHLRGSGLLDQVRMQITAWHERALGALELAGDIRALLCPEDAGGLAGFIGLQGPTLDVETRQFGCVGEYYFYEERS